MRVRTRKANKFYTPDFIQQFSRSCLIPPEELQRVLYYDCPPYNGTVRLPVSGISKEFANSAAWLEDLASRDLFAVRKGVLKFRGFVPKKTPVSPNSNLTDDDFTPVFEQKGVDMRIGLDIANYAQRRSVDRILLVSNDTDCIPALKLARIAGLQTILGCVANGKPHRELVTHADFVRTIPWPDMPQ